MAERIRSADPVSQRQIEVAHAKGLQIVWDRYDAMQPQCGFGQLGLCCKVCNMGPCRIDPFGDGPKTGICGATADTIAARNLVQKIAVGASAHSDHGRDIAHALLLTARGEGKGYQILGRRKLNALAQELGVETDGRRIEEIAEEVAEILLAEFGKQEGELIFAQRAPEGQKKYWREAGIMPRGIDREIVEALHRTHIGVDNDYRSLILGGLKAALGDGWGGSMVATELSDVLFGEPWPVRAKINLGVLSEDEVNLVVHGHEPTLSEMIVKAAQEPEMVKLAKENGAKGINIAGICCTGNEILMRQGIPMAGNFLQQELAVSTGLVEAIVVDVQCIMPALTDVASRFHTKVISTSPKAKFPGAIHIEFKEEDALDIAREIVRTAVENFPNRDPEKVNKPEGTMDLVAGFTMENVFHHLGGRFRATYRPLNDAIIAGRIRGVAGVVGCNEVSIVHDSAHIAMVKELIKHDVLVVQTGCSAIACAKAGLMQPEAAFKYAGKGLQEVCEAVGIPPVLHLGSCVDNSRILMACVEMVKEGGIGEDISELPVAGAAPEWMSDKAISIGSYVVGSGIFTVFGRPLRVKGSRAVDEFLRKGLEDVVGATWEFEEDPVKAAHIMIEHINQKREALKLRPMMYAAEAA